VYILLSYIHVCVGAGVSVGDVIQDFATVYSCVCIGTCVPVGVVMYILLFLYINVCRCSCDCSCG